MQTFKPNKTLISGLSWLALLVSPWAMLGIAMATSPAWTTLSWLICLIALPQLMRGLGWRLPKRHRWHASNA